MDPSIVLGYAGFGAVPVRAQSWVCLALVVESGVLGYGAFGPVTGLRDRTARLKPNLHSTRGPRGPAARRVMGV